LALGFVFFSPRITLQRRLLVSGKHHLELRQFTDAAADFERVVHYVPRSPLGLEAARLGGGIWLYELKDYPRAIFFFRHIVRHSQKPVEVKWAQQKLAELYYEKLSDYTQAVVEYQRLIQANPSREEAAEYKLKLGRSYFYLANFDQAISEAQEFLANNTGVRKKFEFLMLKADSLLAEKKTDDAIEAYKIIEKEFGQSNDLSDVKLNMSLAYEEKKDWDNAVRELEEIKSTYPHPDVLDLKIQSIQRRKARKRDSWKTTALSWARSQNLSWPYLRLSLEVGLLITTSIKKAYFWWLEQS
jgi:tetratricopeptide (TPR) repeat protein